MVPSNFAALLQLIAFQQNREKMRKQIQLGETIIVDKYRKCQFLINLQSPQNYSAIKTEASPRNEKESYESYF